MATVTRTFTTDSPAAPLLDYLADFAHATDWDPGTVRCEPTTEPPVRVGSQWHNTSRLLGWTTELDYTLEVWDAERVVLRGRNASAESSDDISVRDLGDGRSEVTYRASVQMKKAAWLADPVMRLVFERLAAKTVEGIQRAAASLD
ncbi:SRPBCC family protein [Luteipulveratus halotolerans]|uniref:Polyketide cyclase n=1 Tax=Luteipulveratus halotolerans TaxID=1631356 RepID=A0A0L6CF67_9MICO|nr:SRPBCC family protein [Luteipulveratus halotolerans]KNX36163.1 hypothetical protein VV01_01760 [Luteipulveratus halotolerans]